MAEETTPPEEETTPAVVLKKGEYIWGTGRRKASVARVRIRPGSGIVEVNHKPLKEFFNVARMQSRAVLPMVTTNMSDKIDVFVNCTGGGITGQSDAMMLGLARALIKLNPALEADIRAVGYTTRDSRVVERKKYGRPKARKRFQFSKR